MTPKPLAEKISALSIFSKKTALVVWITGNFRIPKQAIACGNSYASSSGKYCIFNRELTPSGGNTLWPVANCNRLWSRPSGRSMSWLNSFTSGSIVRDLLISSTEHGMIMILFCNENQSISRNGEQKLHTKTHPWQDKNDLKLPFRLSSAQLAELKYEKLKKLKNNLQKWTPSWSLVICSRQNRVICQFISRVDSATQTRESLGTRFTEAC